MQLHEPNSSAGNPSGQGTSGTLAIARAAALAVAATFAPGLAAAQTETVLYSFPSRAQPYAAPLETRSGALFVPTYAGKKWGDVTKIFDSQNTRKSHRVFTFDGVDGENPSGALIEGSNHVMFGLTNFGGTNGYGTVYSLSDAGHGWNEMVLHDFTGGSDGGQPRGAIARDATTGVVYGTADGGGVSGCGTVFALVPSSGTWSYSVLHDFAGHADGCYPASGIHLGRDQDTTLFGATAGGGGSNNGTVFGLAQVNGIWRETVLYSFTGGNDGIYPGYIVADGKGNLFGVAGGGAYGAGVVYELIKAGHGWQHSVIYTFTGGSDGGSPAGLAIEGSTGNIFGTTSGGGAYAAGCLFKLVPNASSWSMTVLYSFGGTAGDGKYPASRPVEDPTSGMLYGTTSGGGSQDGGVAYQIAP